MVKTVKPKKIFSTNVKITKMHPREKVFANKLILENKKWIYQPKRFKIQQTHYTPDFYLLKEKLYIEVVGSRQAYHANKNKIEKFRRLYPYLKFKIYSYLGNEIIEGEHYQEKVKVNLQKKIKEAIERIKLQNPPNCKELIDKLIQIERDNGKPHR